MHINFNNVVLASLLWFWKRCLMQDFFQITSKLQVTFFNFVHMIRSSHQKCSMKKVFSKIFQNSQENTCARVSFLINLQAMRNFWEHLSIQNASGGCFSNSFSSKWEDNPVTVMVGSLTTWIGVVTINWLAQAKFLFQALHLWIQIIMKD